MDQRFSNRQRDVAELVLAGVQGEIEAFLRRPIETEEYEEEYFVAEDHLIISATAYFYSRSMDSSFESLALVAQPPLQVRFDHTPVQSISECQIKGRLDEEWRVLEEGRDFMMTKWGADIWAAFQYDHIQVTYTAGLASDAIPYLKLMIIRIAAREMQTQTDDVVGIKDVQTREGRPMAVGLSEDEKRTLKRWKRKQI
jgi:hypothetical protein